MLILLLILGTYWVTHDEFSLGIMCFVLAAIIC